MNEDGIIDRLSALPDDILHHILYFLDTTYSVQTIILSKRWTSIWKYVHALTFNRRSFSSDQSFEQHADQVLSLRPASSRVSKVAVSFFAAEPKRIDLLDRITKYAASRGVQELFICLYGAYPDLFRISASQSLKVLELEDTNFPKAYDELWSSLSMLESLTLTHCGLNFEVDDSFGNFPRLGSLKLVNCFCYGLNCETHVLKVTRPELLNLEIASSPFTGLEIVAPKLQSFILKIDYFCRIRDLSKSNLPSLNRANIKLSRYKHVFRDSTYDAIKQQVLEQCVNLFKILHNIQVLDMEVQTLEVYFSFLL
ncbi:Putative F-box/LRR-repeat protein At3g18150 [Linum grandiflorum]